MIFKRIITSFIIILLSFTYVLAQNEHRALVVETISGDKDYYEFGKNPVITFNKQCVAIATDDICFEYGAKEVSQYYFEIKSSKSDISLDDISILITRISKDEFIIRGDNVYDVKILGYNGVAYPHCLTDTSDGTYLNISKLKSGNYIIVVNNKKSIKIQK